MMGPGLSNLLNPSLAEWVWIFVLFFFLGFESYLSVDAPSMTAMSMLFSCVLMWLRLYSDHSFLVWLQGRSIMLAAKPCLSK